MQNKSNDNLSINSKYVSYITPSQDSPSEGVKGTGTNLISTQNIDESSASHKPQKDDEEQGQIDIKECDPIDI